VSGGLASIVATAGWICTEFHFFLCSGCRHSSSTRPLALVSEGHSEPHRVSNIRLGKGWKNAPSIDSRHLVGVDFPVCASAVVWLFDQAREEKVENLSHHRNDEYPFNFSVPLKRDSVTIPKLCVIIPKML
jgi:hypothetical protein